MKMKLCAARAFVVLLWAGFSMSLPLAAQEDAVAEKLVAAIKESGDTGELATNLEKAKAAGATDQQVAESRLLWAVVREDWATAKEFWEPVAGLTAEWKGQEGLLWKKKTRCWPSAI